MWSVFSNSPRLGCENGLSFAGVGGGPRKKTGCEVGDAEVGEEDEVSRGGGGGGGGSDGGLCSPVFKTKKNGIF